MIKKGVIDESTPCICREGYTDIDCPRHGKEAHEKKASEQKTSSIQDIEGLADGQ